MLHHSMAHQDMVHHAANNGTPHTWFALHPRCKYEWDTQCHAQSCSHGIVCACVYYMHVCVCGAALQMCLVQPLGWRDYAVHMWLQLVLWCMSLLWHTLHGHGPYSYTGWCCNVAQRSMHICMGEVLLWGIEFRVQGAGCRMQVQGELVMLKVCVEW